VKEPASILKTWREELRTALVEEPSIISLTLRWFGWTVALIIILTKAAPPVNLEQAPTVLAITAVQLILMTVYPRHLRKHQPKSISKIAHILWPTMDASIALWAIYQTGGWDSPFYHFAVTVVLAPSLRFGLAGALLSSTLFSLCFLIIVKFTSEGFSPAFATTDQAEPDLISSPLNPLMIGLYAAFLGEVLKKLRRETERSKLLAAENERARMARDIHDGVSQTLFMLSMSLETGQILAQKEQATKTAEHLRKLTPVAQKALIELRNAMHSVETLADGRQSLQEAIVQLVRDYQSATGLNVDCEPSERFDCPPESATDLFRMTQEALSNACQHSGGDKILVRLTESSISITDNGHGFDRSKIKPGRGLGNLEKRANDCHLVYSLESGENGTSVTFGWSEERK
jgi:signal transduction histidine kinase